MELQIGARAPILQTKLGHVSKTNYEIRLSDKVVDPEWDTFLAKTVGGHHVQTSLWAQVKASLGWRAVRLVVNQAEQIVGGAQLLIRSLPLMGAIGYITKGPLFAVDDPSLRELVINKLRHVARTYRLQYLIVQPANNGQVLADSLLDKGFRPSPFALGLAATVRIDLRQDCDQILAQMRKHTRRYIRHGLRQGITGREGTAHDLATFCRLLETTSKRQNFLPYSPQYFSKLWQLYHPHGYTRLFLTEYSGEVVSAQLVIAFGDTVIAKNSGWSGCYGNLGPNHVLDWQTLEWAKAHGYRYYDLEGIDPVIARTILNGGSLTDELKQQHGPTFYKLGFGGEVMLLPGTFDYVYNPLLRWSYATIFPPVAGWPVMKKVINRLRIT